MSQILCVKKVPFHKLGHKLCWSAQVNNIIVSPLIFDYGKYLKIIILIV